jgi:hypothetical protein
MKRDDDSLLKDVLAESTPADLREAMLGKSVRLVQRRNRSRNIQRSIAVFVMTALAAVFTWRMAPHQKIALSPRVPEKSYVEIRTQAMPADAIITTSPMLAEQVLSASSFQIVQTKSNSYRLLNDNELLSLMGPRPCALVHLGPDSEQLVFINPNDANGFPVN